MPKENDLSYLKIKKNKITLECHTEVLSGKRTDLREEEKLKQGTEIRSKIKQLFPTITDHPLKSVSQTTAFQLKCIYPSSWRRNMDTRN